METFDVAVIGAGPAGAMAAWKAAYSGAKTVLLERESHPGRKVCAEGVLGNVLPDAEVSASEGFVVNEISGAVLYAPDERKRVNVGGEGFILDKPSFLSFLADRARDTGAVVRYGRVVEVIARDDGHVVLSGEDGKTPFSVKAKVVIGCDGVGSLLARRFFTRNKYVAIAALQYYMTGCSIEDESKLEIYVGHTKAPSGYLWVFPKGKNEANVGIGLKGGNARQLLDQFVSQHPGMFSDAKIQRSLAAPVPVGGAVANCVADNMMLCGDAAGQVIPLTGAGIHTSLVAGKIAGEVGGKAAVADDCSADSLSSYRERFNRLFGERISNSLKALESFERFSDDDLNIVTEFLEGQDLVDMANGLKPNRAVGLLVRHPILAMKIAYQLLSS